MGKNNTQLNKYEEALYHQITEIMLQEKLKFPDFLPALVDKVPANTSDEYLKTLKKEHMKYRRSSLSIEEVMKMLDIARWQVKFIYEGEEIKLNKYYVIMNGEPCKIRFTDLMMISDLYNIKIEWQKLS